MKCTCGGIYFVKEIEEAPKSLEKRHELLYDRVCDVECIKCGKILYSQPYDFGKSINKVRPLQNDTK